MTAPATGIYGQLGYAAESTYGTPVTPTRFAEFFNESFAEPDNAIKTAGIRSGVIVQRQDRVAQGFEDPRGGFELELHNKGMGLLLKHLVGSVSSAQPDAGGNPTVWEHTITPGSLDALSLTFEIGWKDTAGNGFRKTVEGAQCLDWEIGVKKGEFAKLKSNWVAEHMTVATGVTTASYPSSTTPFHWANAAATIAGGSVSFEEFRLTCKNSLDTGRYFGGSRQRSQCVENGHREITGLIVPEFGDWTAYNRFVNGTTAALTMFLTGGVISGSYSYALEITLNVRFTGETPKLTGLERIMQPLPFEALATSDVGSTALSIKYRTTDSTP